MRLSSTAVEEAGRTWPDVILILGLTAIAFMLVVGVIEWIQGNKKLRMEAANQAELRQLVERYEQLAEKTMDAGQRTAADVAELRTRTQAIEQILRSVE